MNIACKISSHAEIKRGFVRVSLSLSVGGKRHLRDEQRS